MTTPKEEICKTCRHKKEEHDYNYELKGYGTCCHKNRKKGLLCDCNKFTPQDESQNNNQNAETKNGGLGLSSQDSRRMPSQNSDSSSEAKTPLAEKRIQEIDIVQYSESPEPFWYSENDVQQFLKNILEEIEKKKIKGMVNGLIRKSDVKQIIKNEAGEI